MSLQGNLKDFNITNILPILKMEAKTGILEVKDKDNHIRVTFFEGHVVYGEKGADKVIKGLRDTLTSNNMMSADGWKQLETQHKDSLDSIWNVLSTMVSHEIASKLLRRQTNDAVYELMRFTKGVYRFLPSKKVEYSVELITPLDVDFMLMEGARISDELEMIGKMIPKKDVLLRKAILSEEAPDESVAVKLDTAAKEYAESLEQEILKERGITITDDEQKVLSVIGTYASTQDLIDKTDLPYFESCAAIVRLLKKHVIAPISKKKAVAGAVHVKKSAALGYVFLVLLSALTAYAVFHRYNNFSRQVEVGKSALNSVIAIRAESELKKLFYRLKVLSFNTGKVPESLQELVSAGLTDAKDLTDPWGRAYKYNKNEKRFLLFSQGPEELVKGDEVFLSLD